MTTPDEKKIRDISPGATEYSAAQLDNVLRYLRSHFVLDPFECRNYLELVIARAWLAGCRTGLEAARDLQREMFPPPKP